MALPLIEGSAENMGTFVVRSMFNGIGVECIGTIGVVVFLHPLPKRLCLNKLESFLTPFNEKVLDARVFGSNLLRNAFSHNQLY